MFPNSTFLHRLDFSYPFYQEEFTWCVQKARNISMFVSITCAAKSEIWILLIFGVGYGSGLLLYIMIQFDLKYKHRNNRDWHYTTWLIALPAVIGVNQRYHPKYGPIRLYYGFLLIMMVFAWQIMMWYGFRFIQQPVQFSQLATVNDIRDNEFRLVGSAELLPFLSQDSRVIQIVHHFSASYLRKNRNDFAKIQLIDKNLLFSSFRIHFGRKSR